MEDLLESLLAEVMMMRPLQEMYEVIKARISKSDVGFWERGFGQYRELHLFYFFLIESQCESFRQQVVTKEVLIQQGVPRRIFPQNPEVANASSSLTKPVSLLHRRSDEDACRSLAVESVPSRSLVDSHHYLQRKQRLGSSSQLCTVPAYDCERTTPTMLSAEDTLTDPNKAGAIGVPSNPNATSLPICT
ncbi:hypothetical protein MRX96_016756 [Rhipicephalus microplus]